MLRVRLGILILLVFSILISKAQDPHFSQIQYNPIYLNPANAGFAKKDNRVVGLYRDQWRTAPVPFSTTFGSYDRKFKQWEKGWRMGGGISFLYDRAGDGVLSTFNPNISLALGKFFNNEKQLINIGITTGISIKTLDYNKLTFNNQYLVGGGFDPTNPTGEQFSNNNVSYPNFTVGLNFRTKLGDRSSLDIGGTASNLHEPNQNFLYASTSNLPARYGAYAKADFGIGKKENWNLLPGVFYNRQNNINNTLVNAVAEIRFNENDKGKTFGLGFGAGYRVQDNDAAIAYLSVLYDNLRIGASYDANISGFNKATNTVGAFEIALNYEWGEPKENKKKKCDTVKIVQYEYVFDTIYETKYDTIIKEKLIQDNTTQQPSTPSDFDKKLDPYTQEFYERVYRLLPASAYFNNNQPKEVGNYKDIYDNYISKKELYVNNIGQINADKLFNTITSEFDKMNQLYEILKEALDKGRSANIQFLGYTSPLASFSYNISLSQRRIESVKQYLLSLDNGYLQKHMASGKLTFENLPFGESISPTDISDRLSDPIKSIYSYDASIQRRVEIKYIIIK